MQRAREYGDRLFKLAVFTGAVSGLILLAVIAGVFCAGGDTKFGLKCDAVTMWVILIPIGMIAAFVLKLPIALVYAVLSLEECVRLAITVYIFRKKTWMQEL